MDLISFLGKNKIPVALGFLGIIFVSLGILAVLRTSQSDDKLEIISSSAVQTGQAGKEAISADIEGAVVNPGVYQLPSGSRVNELLISAGGLSNQADRDYVEKTLNRAQKLIDGMKIYVPKKGENTTVAANMTGTVSKKVNINVAGLSELDALPGVGQVTARKIIDNRPYVSVENLLTKKVLGNSVYQKLKDSLAVY